MKMTDPAPTEPTTEVIAGGPAGSKPKKRNGYQTRPVGGPQTTKVDVKKSNIWVVSKKMTKSAGETVANINRSNHDADGVTSSQLPSEKNTARYLYVSVKKVELLVLV